MKRWSLILLVVTLLVGVISASAMAFGPANGPQNGQPGMMMKELNLTAEQQQKLLAIRQEFQKDTQNLRFDMQKKRLELRELWKQNPLNQNAIENKQKEITGLQVQFMTKARTMQDKVKSVLTADQLKKLETLRAQHRQGNGMKGHGRRGDFGPGCGFQGGFQDGSQKGQGA